MPNFSVSAIVPPQTACVEFHDNENPSFVWLASDRKKRYKVSRVDKKCPPSGYVDPQKRPRRCAAEVLPSWICRKSNLQLFESSKKNLVNVTLSTWSGWVRISQAQRALFEYCVVFAGGYESVPVAPLNTALQVLSCRSHNVPWKFGGQVQEKLFSRVFSTHSPPFWHGFGVQMVDASQ